MGKVAIIGLDGASPELVFERWRGELPNLTSLMDRGAWGEMRSVHPPITVPAWAVMFSGRDPGQLGIYGFRNRRAHDYSGYGFAHSGLLPNEMIWDTLAAAGKQVILLGVPPSWPPRPVNGCMVSCFLTPSSDRPYTYPAELRDEIEAVAGGYVHDVEAFRSDDKQALLARIHEKTRKQFAVARHLVSTRPWDLFAMVEMGVDRIHHAFWRHFDASHPLHEKNSPFAEAIRTYYRELDAEVGALLERMPSDATVFVLSDHGARALHGSICFNEWLMREGFLVLKDDPTTPAPLTLDRIDWSRTQAWGEGGYYGRLFLNVKGREPEGTIDARDVERVRDDLIARIGELVDPAGAPMGCEALRPEEVYRETRGVPPDLMVYFGDLRWRAAGSVGYGGIFAEATDIGPDDANHDWNGVFLMRDGEKNLGGQRLDGLQLIDMTSTLLERCGVEVPAFVGGRPIRVAPAVAS